MAMKFNPPPGWPEPPEGWLPPEGWTPDASWPAAPQGWRLVIEEYIQGSAPVISRVVSPHLPGSDPSLASHPMRKLYPGKQVLAVALAALAIGGLIGVGIGMGSGGSSSSDGLSPREKGRYDGLAMNINHKNDLSWGDETFMSREEVCRVAVGGVGFIRLYSSNDVEQYVKGCLETVD